MAAQSDPASPRRLQRAREAGDYPRSESLKRGLIWTAALWIAPSAVASLWNYGKAGLTQAISASRAEPGDVLRASGDALQHLTRLTTPLLAVILAASFAAHLAESGGLIFVRTRRRRWSPGGFTVAQWMPWLSLTALLVYGLHWWRNHAVDLVAVLGRSIHARNLAVSTTLHLAWIACSTWLVLGGLELVLSRRAWMLRLRMTRGEKRREQRELEGDPWLSSMRKERHQESLNAPPLALLPAASVIIHAGYETAVLLRYDETRDRAPRVVTIEIGQMARMVIEDGLSAEVPAYEDVELTRILARCRHGSEVPESTYEDVALLIGHARSIQTPLSLDAKLAARFL